MRVAEAGADGDALNAPQNGWTPLHAASSHDHAEVVRALLELLLLLLISKV